MKHKKGITLVSKKLKENKSTPVVKKEDKIVNDTELHYLTSCGVVCGEDTEPVSLETANKMKDLYTKRGYRELKIVKAGDYRAPKAYNNTRLEDIEFNRIYVPKHDDRKDIDYVNMVKFSKSELGVKLSLGSPTSFTSSLFGEIGNIKSFLDYLSNPKYPISLLSKKKISNEMLASIPKAKGRVLSNYWAIVATVMIERFKQDRSLIEAMLTLPKSVKFTMFKVRNTTDVLGNEVNIVTPMNDYLRYCIIVQDIFNAVKDKPNALNNKDTVIKIINKNTMFKDRDIYDGLEFVKKI